MTSAVLIGLESRPTGTGVRARVIHTQLGGITRGGGHTLIDVVLTQSARPALRTHTTAHWVTGGRAHPTVTGGGAIRPPGIGHCTAFTSFLVCSQFVALWTAAEEAPRNILAKMRAARGVGLTLIDIRTE